MRPTAVIFDVGRVLYDWDLRFLYEQLIEDGELLDAFLRDVVTPEWHYQHDAGRSFAETSAELAALHPHHAELIALLKPRFNETNRAMMPGMEALFDELHAAGVPLYAITNFSAEFFPPFREKHAGVFNRFLGIVVSGEEKLIKPDPAIYRLALDRFGLEAERTVFIDDNTDNIAGAESVGLIALHFTGEPKLRRELTELGLLARAPERA
ncbi:HAD family hydrolase [Sphingomonas lenta]|uniref:Hydrolase n=1 Tax=Sphingomonas lenta TaxID=1141887 RepID=A0A2A2SFY2_9SPHN|nr:HAD family phosphatase [Sphingomonas lenta]PAX08100.1 hydrolase [Sphingomonas lenta]